MTTAGVVMMLVSNSVVLGLTVFCFYKVLTTNESETTEHALLDIDTGDLDS